MATSDPTLPASPGNPSVASTPNAPIAGQPNTQSPAQAAQQAGVQNYNFQNQTVNAQPSTGKVFGVNSNTPNTSTTLSNANPIAKVPEIAAKTADLAKPPISADANGNANYANGDMVPPAPETPPSPTYATTPSNDLSKAGISQGGYVGEVYYAPGSVLPLGADGKPSQTTATSPTDDQILNSINTLKAQNDATTQNVINGIQANYNRLIEQQKQSNASQEAGVQTALLKGGVTGQGSSSQYAPISSSGIFQAQVNYGLQKISDLNDRETSAIASAQQAGQNMDFQLQDKMNSLALSIRDEKVTAAQKINDQIAAQNQAIATQNLQAKTDTAISDLYSKGITDPNQILKTLNAQGLKLTSSQVAATLKNISPSLDEQKFAYQQKQDVISNQLNSDKFTFDQKKTAFDQAIQSADLDLKQKQQLETQWKDQQDLAIKKGELGISAARLRMEQQNASNANAPLTANDLKPTATGTSYVDVSKLSGKELTAALKQAADAGVKPVRDTNEAKVMDQVTTAVQTLNMLENQFAKLAPKSAIGRFGDIIPNFVSKNITDTDYGSSLKQYESNRTALFQLISGLGGTARNGSALQSIANSLPKLSTFSLDSYKDGLNKLSAIRQELINTQDGLLGTRSTQGQVDSSYRASTLNDYYNTHPDQQQDIKNATSKFPNLSPDEVLQLFQQ